MPRFLTLVEPLFKLPRLFHRAKKVFTEFSELTSIADTSLLLSDESQSCRDKWLFVITNVCYRLVGAKINLQCKEFRLTLPTGSGGSVLQGQAVEVALREGCRATLPPCCQSSAENKSTSLKNHTESPKIFKIPWSYVNAPSSPRRYELPSRFI